jgi:8-oxo-dGTP diphosphatase
VTIYLVRHAHAGSRSRWDGPDSARPLSKRGRKETDGITAWFDSKEVERVLSSSAVRCRQTVEPLAAVRGLEVHDHGALSEGTGARTTSKLVWELATDGVEAVLCSHGDVIPAVLDALADDGVEIIGDELPKGTLYRLTIDDGRILRATFEDPRA